MVFRRPGGFAAFLIVWGGQLLSLVGTVMTQFALTVWAYQVTGQATALALVGFFSFAPGVIFMPFAGAIVDRSNRKAAMMISDVAALISAVAILLLYNSGGLQIWQLCAAGWFTGTFQAFHWPAYSAATSLMVPKKHYSRANSLLAVADFGSNVFAPVLASLLLVSIGIGGIMTIDIISYCIAIVSLLCVMIPPVAKAAQQRPILSELGYGFRYIAARRGLLYLQLVYFVGNFASQIVLTLVPAMILARTASNNDSLARVQTAIGVGGLVGALIITATGGPQRKVYGVLSGWLLYSAGMVAFGMGRAEPAWIIAGFAAASFVSLLDSSNQSIWQSKVAPNVQGRVFAARAVIARCAAPLAALIAGPLADYVFEPALRPDGSLSGWLGPIFGAGKGSGMGLLISIAGLIGMSAALIGFAVPLIRRVERAIPDHDQAAVAST